MASLNTSETQTALVPNGDYPPYSVVVGRTKKSGETSDFIRPTRYTAVYGIRSWPRPGYGTTKKGNTYLSGFYGGAIPGGTPAALFAEQLRNRVTDDAIPGYPALRARVQNLAYSRFMDEVTPIKAALGTAAVEIGSTSDMIVGRAKQLGRAYMALRSGNFRKFSEILGLKKRTHKSSRRGTRTSVRYTAPTKWTRPRDASALWLEYWMGWAPTVGDIDAAFRLLMSSPKTGARQLVKASATRSYAFPLSYSSRSSTSRGQLEGKFSIRYTTYLTLKNANSATLQAQGALNPASIAWSVIPFSFMVDWFANVGQMLDSFTDLVGYEQERSCLTEFDRGQIWSDNTETTYGLTPGLTTRELQTFASVSRQLQDLKPVFEVRIPDRLSVTRAATSIALLVSIFSPASNREAERSLNQLLRLKGN